MKKAVHLYVSGFKKNSGDFFLGSATKWKFEKTIGEKVKWETKNIRKIFDKQDLEEVNQSDYLLIGGGGLLLPDTNANNISCWQWPASRENIAKIESDIYVISIGWNLFYNQKVTMPNVNSNQEFHNRRNIFKENIETLIDKSTHFSIRHTGDLEKIKEIVDKKFHSKMKFEFCPVIEYVESLYKKGFVNEKIYHTFEIKDDRPHRRFHKKGKNKFYQELLEYIQFLIAKGEKIAVMSHDGSSSFYNFLKLNKIPFVLLDNSVANEKSIIKNYSKVKKLYCTAGHSQMTAHALGIEYYSLICHDKLKYFLEDTNRFTKDNYCLVNEENINDKLVSANKNIRVVESFGD